MYNQYPCIVTKPVTGAYIFAFSLEYYHTGPHVVPHVVESLKVDGVNQVDDVVNRGTESSKLLPRQFCHLDEVSVYGWKLTRMDRSTTGMRNVGQPSPVHC
ncbi:hypothetical protein DPMN_127404 [Dreissena polymorpha]|uniref:Uncharacterized protein n=1 Tax=Dreissena polymorpha TaxID=45954 RepID=A0A9D4H562_DREPO|nr:hypothetical protein DPMN_127404 [Dreissena polymorpha]